MTRDEMLSFRVDIPEGEIGFWGVEKYSKTEEFCTLCKKRINTRLQKTVPPPGDYTRMKYDKGIVMLDEPVELATNINFVERAHGDVLVTGLGLGVMLSFLMKKDTVKSVTVLENSAEVLSLCGDLYKIRYPGEELRIIFADAWAWESNKKYDCAWHDCWVPEKPDKEALKRIIERYKEWIIDFQDGWPNHINAWKLYC